MANEPAANRIEREWIAQGAAISSVDLGEALHIRMRGGSVSRATAEIEAIRKNCTVVDVDWQLVLAAARIKARGGLAYADAFCVATAERLGSPLWTGDPEIISLATDFSCEIEDLR